MDDELIDLRVTPAMLELLTTALEYAHARGEVEASDEQVGKMLDQLAALAPK